MPNSLAQSSQELKSRYGKDFFELVSWAKDEGFLSTLEVLIHVLGLQSYGLETATIANLADEFTRPDSTSILQEWSATPEVRELIKISNSFINSSVARLYPTIIPSGSAKQISAQFTNYRRDTYLLAMLANPLAYHPKNYELRQMFRLWLVVHGVIRVVRYQYHSDKKISELARFLVKGAKDSDWTIIDKLLIRANNLQTGYDRIFDASNNALIQAAESLLQENAASGKTKGKKFLNYIVAVGNYERNPYDNINLNISINLPLTPLRVEAYADTFHVIEADLDENSPQLGFNYLPVASAVGKAKANERYEEFVEDDTDPLLLYDVDPTTNEAEQLLPSRSIHLVTAEAAHFLPWSFEQILPSESRGLIAWLDSCLNGFDLPNALGACLCYLALNTGRTLDGVRQFKVSNSIDSEWVINEEMTLLYKEPTRRQSSWREDKSTASLVEQYHDELAMKLDEKLTRTLIKAVEKLTFKPETLHDIWRVNVPETKPEVWLNQTLPTELKRITTKKLSAFLGQQVFNNTADHNLARSVTAHPKSGLPGACAYAAWDIDAIERGIEKPLQVSPSVSPKTNLLGSLLSPLEGLLIQQVDKANSVLDAKDHDLIEYHNLISQYVVSALYAATGARYLKDPFESITHFNWSPNFLFINDKTDNELHNGRVVPLPQKAVKIVKSYIDHLQKLVLKIQPLNAELAKNIMQAASQGSDSIPLFFLLDDKLNWRSMNALDLPGVPLFEWGLPKNLFRHRYAQHLYKADVPVEVIDGFMGHAERGVITYGDTSPRCWVTDASAYSTHINAIFDALPFKIMTPETDSLLFSVPDIQVGSASVSRLFGQHERKKQRSVALRKNIREARADICNYLRGRALIDLTSDEVQQLINLMLFRNEQLGHHFAAVRLSILRKQIHREASEHISVFRKRAMQNTPDKYTLNETVALSYQTFQELESWRIGITGCRSQYSKSLAVLIGTVILAIDKRIAYPRLLNDVLEGRNFRLIQDKRQIFIEYSEELDIDNPYTPIQRHEINQQIASLISYGLDRKRHSFQQDNKEVITLKKILRLVPEASNGDMLQALAYIVEQANHVALPGMVGAMLAGRVLATSLPMEDYVRTKYGKTLIWEAPLQIEELHQIDNIQSVLTGRVEIKDTVELKANAAQFRKDILSALNNYKPSQSKATAKEINSICSSYEAKISNALLLVGFWIGHIVKRGRRNRKSKPLAESTIKTYWSVLFTTFEQLAYQSNLIEMDSDEITSLYRDMIDYRLIKSGTLEYFGQRLMDFQFWAKDFGVLEPEWSELDFKDEGRVARPGLLTEHDYQSCLEHIRLTYSDTETQLLMSFLLLLTYRFGLRSREASGLLARDWCENEHYTWVLIRNNKNRKLKTESSRRPVPLLFSLSDLEARVIEQTLTRYHSLAGNNKNRPLFCELENEKIVSHSLIPAMPGAIISVIRAVTGSSNLVLHHARHSFHNRIAAALLEIETPMTQALNKGIDKVEVQKIVLGTHHSPSRRSSMALARLMGHSSPITGMHSYNHLLAEWADQLTPVTSQRIEVSGVINTKEFRKHKAPKRQKIKIEYQPATIENIFKLLRLVAIGWSYEKAGNQLGLSPALVQELESTFNQANDKMRFNKRGDKSKVMGAEVPNALLRYINSDAWQRILSIAAAIPDEALENLPALPSLQELPNLVSRHRQVLIETEGHATLVKLVLELFSIDKENYSVCAKNDDPNMTAFLQEQGFEVTKVKYASYKATPIVPDVFEVYENGILTGTRTNYGVLNIFRNEGSVRSSNELAVVVLGIGALDQNTLCEV